MLQEIKSQEQPWTWPEPHDRWREEDAAAKQLVRVGKEAKRLEKRLWLLLGRSWVWLSILGGRSLGFTSVSERPKTVGS